MDDKIVIEDVYLDEKDNDLGKTESSYLDYTTYRGKSDKKDEDLDWWKRGYYYGGYTVPASSSPVKYGTGGFGRSISDPFDYKSRYKSSFNWSGTGFTGSGSLFTSYYNHVSSDDINKDEKILTSAYRSVRDMVVILNFPFKVDIKITNTGRSYYYDSASSITERTRGRIFIPTKILDEPDTSYNDQGKIEVFCGLGLHEAAHLKFTKIKVYKELNSVIAEKLGDKYSPTKMSFLKLLIDMLEDERVEDSLLKERPGYSNFIEKSKGYMYKKFIEARKTNEHKSEKYLNNLFRLIRYPEHIEESALTEFSDSYQRIRDIILPLPQSTKESCEKGLQVFDEIIRYFKEISLINKGAETISDAMIDASLDLNKLGQNILHTYGIDGDLGHSGDYNMMSETVKTCGHLYEQLMSGEMEGGSNNSRTYFYKEPGDRTLYNKLASRIQKYVPGIRKLIKGTDKNYEFSIYGCRNGLLDTNKLAEAYQGVPQVYIRKGYVTTNKTTVCVLIDESGSMSYREKDKLARDAAILLNEALGNLNGVSLYIYGHTADLDSKGGRESTNIKIYKEDTHTPKQNVYSLVTSCANFENRDGVAILETAKRIRKFTQEHVLMFILSDGEPSACGYRGNFAVADTKRKVKETENLGFTIVQVCIDYVPHAKDMFDNVIDLRGKVENLPKELSKIIKKAVVNDKKTEVFG